MRTRARKSACRLALAVAVGAVGAACGPNPPAQAPAPPALTQASSAVDRGTVADETITRVLLRELRADPVVSREDISVDSVLGIVTLWGTVGDQLAKERAVELAQVVRGVRAVVDRVSVAARPRPDYELEFAVAGALSRDPVTAEQRIAARSHEAIVTLTGDVDSNAARRIADSDVLAIPGVRDVVDDLAVRPGPRPDGRLQAEVARVVADDPWLDDSRVRVEADGGVVKLAGYVGSAAEQARAENDARSASPRAVDTRGLRVEQFIDDGTLRARPHSPRFDGDIGQALLDAYVRDPRVAPFVPSIDVHDGAVVLTGVAPNADAARAAADDARNVTGVNDVRDDIKTAPTLLWESDARVRDEIARAIARDPRLSSLDLGVEVLRGRVFLRGAVPSEADRLHAIALASSAAGARDVQDGLTLVPRMGVTNPQPPP